MKENEGMYAYIRVSSTDQNVDRQMLAIQQLELPRSHIFIDRVSGKDFDRPQYQRMLRRLRPGDLLIVMSIDRLGRNYEEILEQWRFITKEKHADIVVLDMPLLDTRKDRDLIGTLISDIVLQLLSYVAQTEREFIRQRQAEGIAAARAKGVHLGRFPKTKPENYPSVVSAWKNGELTASQAAEALETSYKTFMKWVRESEQERAL